MFFLEGRIGVEFCLKFLVEIHQRSRLGWGYSFGLIVLIVEVFKYKSVFQNIYRSVYISYSYVTFGSWENSLRHLI